MSMADFFYDFSIVERQQHACISVVKYRAISGLDIGKHFSDKVHTLGRQITVEQIYSTNPTYFEDFMNF